MCVYITGLFCALACSSVPARRKGVRRVCSTDRPPTGFRGGRDCEAEHQAARGQGVVPMAGFPEVRGLRGGGPTVRVSSRLEGYLSVNCLARFAEYTKVPPDCERGMGRAGKSMISTAFFRSRLGLANLWMHDNRARGVLASVHSQRISEPAKNSMNGFKVAATTCMAQPSHYYWGNHSTFNRPLGNTFRGVQPQQQCLPMGGVEFKSSVYFP